LKFEPEAEIGQKVPFCKGLDLTQGIEGIVEKKEETFKHFIN
jgi:hypothetical protein